MGTYDIYTYCFSSCNLNHESVAIVFFSGNVWSSIIFFLLFICATCNTLTSIPLVLRVYLLFSFSRFYLAFIISPFLFNLA